MENQPTLDPSLEITKSPSPFGDSQTAQAVIKYVAQLREQGKISPDDEVNAALACDYARMIASERRGYARSELYKPLRESLDRLPKLTEETGSEASLYQLARDTLHAV